LNFCRELFLCKYLCTNARIMLLTGHGSVGSVSEGRHGSVGSVSDCNRVSPEFETHYLRLPMFPLAFFFNFKSY